VDMDYPISQLASMLVFMRYDRHGEDFVAGSFRVKGDVVDIFMPYDDFPIRLEFYGDTIERISYIEAITKHRVKEVKEVEIYPAAALVYDQPTVEKALMMIKRDLDMRVNFLKNIGKDIEANRLLQKTNYDMEMIREVGYCKSMENYSIYF